jgi:hypothetical protein
MVLIAMHQSATSMQHAVLASTAPQRASSLAHTSDALHCAPAEPYQVFSKSSDHVQVRVMVAGPEPGYVATPLFLVHAAAELLESRMPIALAIGRGGVVTPGLLLLSHADSYIARLQGQGISISEEQVHPPLVA